MHRLPISVILAGFLAVSACGGGDSSGSSSAAGTGTSQASSGGAQATVGSASSTLHATLTEFALTLDKNEAPSGRVTIDAKNDGTVAHQIVIANTDLDADKLPVQAGIVDVAKLKIVGKLTEFAAKTVSSDGFGLAAGRYVLFCNVPGHYQAGMHTVLTIR